MKVTIKGWIFHRQYEWDKEVKYEFFRDTSWADAVRVPIMEHSFEVEIPNNFNPTPAKIATLRAEKQRILAESQAEANNIEAQIQELLCIENKGDTK